MRPILKTIIYSFSLLAILLMMNSPAFSQQPKLVLSKLGKTRNIVFYEGEEIWVKVNGEDNYVGGLIIGLRDSTIKFRFYEIPVKEITEVNIDGMSFGGFNVGQYGPMLIASGPLYLGIDWLNQGEVTSETLIQTASIMGVGYILWKLRRKKFKVRKRNRIQTVRI